MTGRDLDTAELLAQAYHFDAADLLAASAVLDAQASRTGSPHLARIADDLTEGVRHITTTTKENTDDHE